MDMDDNKYCISLSNIKQASQNIQNVAHITPVLTCNSIGSPYTDRAKFFFKVEAFQKTGSFKFRGALNAISELIKEKGSNDDRGIEVVTHSSGNHAQALALASKLATKKYNMSVKATIVMPSNAPSVKKSAVASYLEGTGGSIVEVANTNEAREEKADQIVAEQGAHFVHPSEDPRVIAGQGTVCYEFINQVRSMLLLQKEEGVHHLYHEGIITDPPLDIIIIPVGGGGLASGNIICLRELFGQNIRIVLAEPSELDDAKRSFDTGTLVGHEEDNELASVADGLKTTLGPNTWPIVRDFVDDIFTVSEEDILKSTKLIWERLKICIEPSAGVGVAVARSEDFFAKYLKNLNKSRINVGIVLCGGNVDIIKVANMMDKL